MPGFSPIHPVVGAQPFNTLFTPDTVQRWPLGMCIDAVDPYFGFGRFMYGQAVAAQTPGTMVSLGNTFVATVLPATATMARNIYFAAQNFAINTFGWYQFEGMSPGTTSAAVVANTAAYIGTAGNLSATLVAGRAVLGITIQQIGTFAITKANSQTQNGSPVIGVQNVEGLFVGLTLSGTGVAAGTILTIDPSGRFITNTANSTATGSVTLTGTYTNYCLVSYNCPNTQGNIT